MDPTEPAVYLLDDTDRHLTPGGPAIIAPDGTRHDIPPRVYEAIHHLESILHSGLAAEVIPRRLELPLEEAAAVIGMHTDELRHYVANDEIPFRSSEYVDWVKLADVLAFHKKLRATRREALRKIVNEEPWDDPDGSTTG